MKHLPCLFLLLVLGTTLRAHAQGADKWLVVIGNNSGDRSETTLLFAEKDAQEMAEGFRSYGGVSARHTTVLLDERADSVRRALIDLNAEIRSQQNQGKQSMLIVFYSGHADAESLHLDGTHLALDELRKVVEGSPATMRLLVVDACRSGSVTRVKGVKPAASFAIDLEDQSAAEGFAIITSSAAGESSQESDDLQGSFFSHHLMNALRGAADRDADGRVTLNEAYSYAYTQTLRSTGRTVALQHPTYSYDVKGRAPVVLATPLESSARSGFLQLANSATYLITKGPKSGPLVAEVSPEVDHVRVALPEGEYMVQERLREEYREYHVNLPRGNTVDLAHQPFESAQYDRLVRQRGSAQRLSHGLMALGAARGQLVDGEGVTPQLVLGYTLDFPWSTAALRVRGSRATSESIDGTTRGHHDELGIGFAFSRVLDLRWFSAGFGVTLEGALHHQTRKGLDQNTSRTALGFNFGALASIERHLAFGSALRLEGGPVTSLYRSAKINAGEQSGSNLSSILTWWAAAGLVWRL
jgi:hypothetical protein